MDAVSIVQLNVTTFELALNVDGIDLDRAEILTPSSLLVCSSFQFLNRNRSIDVAPTSSRCRRSFCLPDSIHSTMVAHDAMLYSYFLSPFPLYIYFETRRIKVDGLFLRFDSCIDLAKVFLSNVVEEVDRSTSRSLCSNGGKSEVSFNSRPLFPRCLFLAVDFLEFSLEISREIFAPNIRGIFLPREQNHFDVRTGWLEIFLADKRDLPGFETITCLFLFFFFIFQFFPPVKNKKTWIVFFNFSRSVSRNEQAGLFLNFQAGGKFRRKFFKKLSFFYVFPRYFTVQVFRQESELMAKLLIQRFVPLRVISSFVPRKKNWSNYIFLMIEINFNPKIRKINIQGTWYIIRSINS